MLNVFIVKLRKINFYDEIPRILWLSRWRH